MPNILIENITKKWGKYYGVKNLSLKIKDGSFATILGPSGCGKTTLLRMIAGLENPTYGKITIGDKIVFDSENNINISPNKRNIGFIFQDYALWPNMTAYKNISFGLESKNIDKEQIDKEVIRISELFKIGEYLDKYPDELSGGQKQRVAVARTLITKPEIILMDEPLSSLDAKLKIDLRYELKKIHMQTNSTIVYVTHDQLEAMELSTNICIMENAVLQQYDTPINIYKKPINTFVANFVGSPEINFLDVKNIQVKDNLIECSILNDNKIKIVLDNNKKINEQLQNNSINSNYKNDYICKQETINGFENIEENDGELQLIIGIRPECIKIYNENFLECNNKKLINAQVYAYMPTGVYSIIKLIISNTIITAIVYGFEKHKIGETVKICFDDSIVLFNKKNNCIIDKCNIEII